MQSNMQMLMIALTALVVEASSSIKLVTFDGAKGTTWKWKDVNDPVMGGKSKATFVIANDTGIFQGLTAIVPSLKAPGFCNTETTNGLDGLIPEFRSVAGTTHMSLRVRHTGPAFKGYKLSFAANTLIPQFHSFKAPFEIQTPGQWETVLVPFSSFSNDWSGYTGRCDTIDPTGKAHKCCNSTYPEVCPSEKNKRSISQVGIWSEGVEGTFKLEVQWIGATTVKKSPVLAAAASPVVPKKPDWPSSCSGPVQKSLRFNVSSRFNAMPFPTPEDESLADAVCCDPDFKPYAEPQHFFSQADVKLFARLNATGENTFYDSVCGLPLFTAPRGRTFADFKEDTTEHGWPSFRKEEVITANVNIDNSTGEVTSKCGTHLGSFLPDEKGPRYCLDLSCLSGHEQKHPSMVQALNALEVEPLREGDVTLYKLSGGECGQATLEKKYESYAIRFAGLKEGTCKAEGYTIQDGSQTLQVPVLGEIAIAKFKR